MFLEIFKFELKYRARRADTYIYFAILFLYSIIAVDVIYGDALGPLHRNAPLVIARTMGITSAFFMMIISMIMGVAALRDFDHRMDALMFVLPIKKRDYLFGRFLGSFVVLLLVFIGLPLGLILGNFMPWHEVGMTLNFNLWAYIQPFLSFVVPTLFFGGAIFFVSGALSRRLMVVYVQGVFFLMLYIIGLQLLQRSDMHIFASLLDPFTFQTIAVDTRYWSVEERNSLLIGLEGVLLYNRLIWMGIGAIVLWIGYVRFSFKTKRIKTLKKFVRSNAIGVIERVPLPSSVTTYTTLPILWKHTWFYFKSILKEAPYWAIVGCAMAILLISSINLDTAFGVDSYPTTYIILGELIENTILFFVLIIVFYSGELVWKERDTKLANIYDTLPISDLVRLTSKLAAVILSFTVLIVGMILAGVLFQTINGYYTYELDVYFSGFFLEIYPFLLLFTALCFFFQVLLNHKFLAHLVVLIFTGFATIGLQVLGYDHGLYVLGGMNMGTYSDMNGYGHFLTPFLWFKTYWMAIASLIFLFAILLSVRGTDARFIQRWKESRRRLTKPLLRFGIGAIAIWLLSGSYIFYNTNVLNDYTLSETDELYQADYEKTLKAFEYMPQPKIVAVHMKVDLFPSELRYTATGRYILTNPHDSPIADMHIQKLPSANVTLDYVDFTGNFKVDSTYANLGHVIYTLDKPLQPGDSLKMEFKQRYTTTGFTEGPETHMAYNGTFFDNFHFPSLGYFEDIELAVHETRVKYGLGPKVRRPKIDDQIALKEGKSAGDGEEVDFEMVLSTEADQMAIAPGNLEKDWMENDRHYFQYKMNTPMSNFYSIVSARYESVKEQWISPSEPDSTPVSLEIYYHKGHEYNLDRMMLGMRRSLDYYSTQFSPYPYNNMRIMEVPSYKKRAQAFPNTIPFSESIGFIMDIDDKDDVDMVYYITAHETAHQWWGHQINPAHVQGMGMISESLAQYSAIMALEQQYSKEASASALKLHLERYLSGRSQETVQEMPLSLVESGQQYIHYGKGLVNLYAFKDYVSEDSLNIALKRFITDWNSFTGVKKLQTDAYPTTRNLLRYFKEVTPDSLQYVIPDLFESITFHESSMIAVSYEQLDSNKYQVYLEFEVAKTKLDSLGKEHPSAINDWIDVGIYGQDPNQPIYLKKHRITNEQNGLKLIVNETPTAAGIDPLHLLIDRDGKNNVLPVQKKE
ncbi:MAG: ABC-2 type transport system permease protein [Flavobacteriales bacterium]|jgi:hypothetical protein